MEYNIQFTNPVFKGTTYQNGIPVKNQEGYWTIGGFIDPTNTQPAYFGVALSYLAANPNSFFVGFPTGAEIFAGIHKWDGKVAENSPFKPNYQMAGLPATAIAFGLCQNQSYTTTIGTTPVRSSIAIANNSTGAIEFLNAGSSIPTGWTQIATSVYDVDSTTNNVSLFVSSNIQTVGGAEMLELSRTMASATPGTVRTIYGQIETMAGATSATATMTSGNLVGVRGEVDINEGTITGSYLYGCQGKGIMNASSIINDGSAYFCGVCGQIDLSLGTTTSGHIAAVIANIYDSSNSARASADVYYAETPLHGSGFYANSVLRGIGSYTYGLDLSGAYMSTALLNLPAAGAGTAIVTASVALSGITSAGYIVIDVNGSPFKVYYAS